MRTRPRLAFLATLAALTLPQPALAQTFVKAGGTVRLQRYWSFDKSCTPLGKITISVIRSPQFGTIKVVETSDFPRYLPSNPHSVCNTKKGPITEVLYQAKPGAKGLDTLAFDVIFPDKNRPHRVNLFVSVR